MDDDETKTVKLAEISDEKLREQQRAADEDIDTKPTILFIDSDREAVEISCMVLENIFDVMIAETGELGLAMAFNKHPSLIWWIPICRASMDTGYAGYCVRRRNTKNIPSPFSRPDRRVAKIQKCFASGADDFIVKPFSGKELVERYGRLLMKKKEQQTFK